MAANGIPEEVLLRVFLYEEDNQWVALALEMDLRGHGTTKEDAFEELKDLVAMQISFAAFKGQWEMIWKDAEPVWFSRFEQERRVELEDSLKAALSKTVRDVSHAIASLPLPAPHVIEQLSRGFTRDAKPT